MRKAIFLLPLLLLFAVASYSQDQPDSTPGQPSVVVTPDTTKDDPTAKGTQSQAATNAAADTSNKLNADSASLANDLDFQKRHPEVLYANKAKNFTISLIFGFLIVLGIGLYLFWGTELCRNLSYDPVTNVLRPLKERPFSYSRVQLFWWTLIILACFFTFYLYTGTLVALNPSVVLLLGGGLATSIFGRVMDNNQISRDNDNDEPDVPVRHQDISKTKGLFNDIMSDEGGVTIHRFQAVIFNLVFGLGFISLFLVYVKAMKYPLPEFETWQLTLLGISAAGYLGLKTNENSAETLTKRQLQAVKKNDPPKPDPVTGLTKAGVESSAVAKKTTPAFETMKAKLAAKGMMN